jgi:ribonuclease HI
VLPNLAPRFSVFLYKNAIIGRAAETDRKGLWTVNQEGAAPGEAGPGVLFAYSDASFTSRSRRARGAFVIQSDHQVIHQERWALTGCANSTEAEFAALCACLAWLEQGVWPRGTTIIIRSDAQSIMDALDGAGYLRTQGMAEAHRRAVELAAGLRSRGYEVVLQWVPREYNLRADSLAVGRDAWLYAIGRERFVPRAARRRKRR